MSIEPKIKIPNEIYLNMNFPLVAAITGLLFLIGYVLDEFSVSTCLEGAGNTADVAQCEGGRYGVYTIVLISWITGLGVSFYIAMKKVDGR